MKKIIKLTEDDLARIVRRVVNEGVNPVVTVNADQDFPHMMNQKGTWVADQEKITFYDQSNKPTLHLAPRK